MAAKPEDTLLTLSVRGRAYQELRSTLVAHDGPLAAIARGDIGAATDGDGHPYVDCDPELFQYVGNYLRRQRAFLPDGFDRWDELRADFDFLALPFPDDARAAEEAQCTAKRKRDQGPSIVTLTAVDYGYHDRVFDTTRNLVAPNREPHETEEHWFNTFDAMAPVEYFLRKNPMVFEVKAINEDGKYTLQHETTVSGFRWPSFKFKKIGTWLERIESADVSIGRTFETNGGWWKIDEHVVRTLPDAMCRLAARGYQQTASMSHSYTTVLTFSKPL